MWIGHASAAGSWGHDGAAPYLDYYVYSAFSENPSNQCLVHSYGNCAACIQKCNDLYPGSFGYWLPASAYLREKNPCLTGDANECPLRGYETVVWNWKDRPAGSLWREVEHLLEKHSAADNSVFDILMDQMVNDESDSMKPNFPNSPMYA
mmetsp:Transcript_50688/g.91033  ORF Transcript_50688/g.91033 Transcript_50688/m.91033 type:complete len:150 (-) Transcript_50688:76-525(-)